MQITTSIKKHLAYLGCVILAIFFSCEEGKSKSFTSVDKEYIWVPVIELDKDLDLSEFEKTLDFSLQDTVVVTENDVIYKDSARLALEEATRKAWRRSMFIPGWGQITNGGYWWIKVPIIYGGFVTAGLVFEFNNRYYRSILKDVQYRLANNHAIPPDSPYDYIKANPQGTNYLINTKDFYRRNRDITIFATIGWYALNIIEAYSDSMLKNRWYIGDDVQVNVTPTVLQPQYTYNAQMSYGLSLKLNFGK